MSDARRLDLDEYASDSSAFLTDAYQFSHPTISAIASILALRLGLVPFPGYWLHRHESGSGPPVAPEYRNRLRCGHTGDTHYLVMEYVDGCDLAAVVKASGPLSVDDALRCLLQAGRGIIHAHAKGIIHRDIKPSNLLADRNGTIKVLDMGLA